MSRIAILGAGSWGTTLAIVLSRATKPHEVWLWSRDANQAQAISRFKENRKYLPQVNVPAAIRVTHAMGDALRRLVAEMSTADGSGAEAVAAFVRRKGGDVDRVREAVQSMVASGLSLSKLTVAASMLGDLARN